MNFIPSKSAVLAGYRKKFALANYLESGYEDLEREREREIYNSLGISKVAGKIPII